MNKFLISVFFLFAFSVASFQAFSQDSAAKPATNTQVIDHTVLLYPNPVLNESFSVISETGLIKSVEVLNVIGQRVKKVINETGYPYNILVKIPDTEKGMYLVRITFADKKTLIQKILVK